MRRKETKVALNFSNTIIDLLLVTFSMFFAKILILNAHYFSVNSCASHLFCLAWLTQPDPPNVERRRGRQQKI